jgi:hypothetical protein
MDSKHHSRNHEGRDSDWPLKDWRASLTAIESRLAKFGSYQPFLHFVNPTINFRLTRVLNFHGDPTQILSNVIKYCLVRHCMPEIVAPFGMNIFISPLATTGVGRTNNYLKAVSSRLI